MLAAGCGGYVHLAHVRGPAYGPGTRRLLAERCASSVLVSGRKRPAAARSLGCVSEALVRDAPCSVLVVPAS